MEVNWISVGTSFVIGLAILLLLFKKLQDSKCNDGKHKGARGPSGEREQHEEEGIEGISMGQYGGQMGDTGPQDLDGSTGPDVLQDWPGEKENRFQGEEKGAHRPSGERDQHGEEEIEGISIGQYRVQRGDTGLTDLVGSTRTDVLQDTQDRPGKIEQKTGFQAKKSVSMDSYQVQRQLMSKEHKSALTKYLPILQENLKLTGKLWGILLSQRVLTDGDVQAIKSSGFSDEDIVLHLVQVVKKKPDDCFTKFLDALSQTGHCHLVLLLEELEGKMAESTLERQTLGRQIQLGMLYDCRNDTIIPELTLWDPAVIQNDREVMSNRDHQVHIISSEDIDDTLSALNIQTSLKISLFSGLVKVSGSANCINDRKTSDSQCRSTLQYKATSKYEQLTMTHLGRHNVKHQEVFDQGTATHVVIGVWYGAQAFFIFDRAITQDEDKNVVQENMNKIVKSISSLDAEGKGNLQWDQNKRKELEKVRCMVYGDIALVNNPTSYIEAVSIYEKLSSMLDKNGGLAVPIKMRLYPLSNLDLRATALVREVSVDIGSQIQNIVVGLDELQVACDDLKSTDVCRDFSHFIKRLDLCKILVTRFKPIFQQKLAHILPKVRAGKEKQQSLSGFLWQIEKSPFNPESLRVWTKCMKKDIKIVKVYMKILDHCRTIRSAEELQNLMTDFNIDHLVCFSFTFTGHEDTYLNKMADYCETQIPESCTPPKGICDDVTVSNKMRITARQFSDFAKANSTSTNTVCAVIGFDDCDLNAEEAVSVILYQNGVLTATNFTPPGVLEKPEITEIFHDAITLEWTISECDSVDLQQYLVLYRDPTGNCTAWSEFKTNDKKKKATIPNLNPNTFYEFSVAAVCKVGVSKASVTSDLNKTFAASPPSGLKKHEVSKKSITVTWKEPFTVAEDVTIAKYIIKYKTVTEETPEGRTLIKQTEEPTCLYTIDGLKSDEKYRIWVSVDCGQGGSSRFCNPVDICTDSEKTIATELTKHAAVIGHGPPSIYQLPLLSGKHKAQNKYPHYHFGEQASACNRHLVIMLIGAAGAGKTTLINGMINYILNVGWDDPFRFKIISEHGENRSSGQDQSQAQLITSYTIHHQLGLNISSTITIIDTPGFGDTRVIERDTVITDQIREFFSESSLQHIDHIDAIGFVAQSSQESLTHAQKYMFDSILAIFAKDIAKKIMLLITSDDGQKPPVMDAMKAAQVPYGSFFKFNNSALFAYNKARSREPNSLNNNSNDEESYNFYDKRFWKKGVQSVKNFFIALDRAEPGSCTLTKEVLEEHKRLVVTTESLKQQINIGCRKQESLIKDHRLLEQCKTEIKTNSGFTYQVEVPRRRQVHLNGAFQMCCAKCHFTCHYPCSVKNDDKDKINCKVMSNGRCTVCPGKCVWNVHFNQSYRFEFYKETETRTYAELEERYKNAIERKRTVEQSIKKHQSECLNVQRCVSGLIAKSQKSLKRLEEIALRPNHQSKVEYEDLMIKAEKQGAQPGWSTSVKQSVDESNQADILRKIKQANYDPFESYKKEFVEKEKDKKK